MLNKFNKIISILLTMIFIIGIFPTAIFAEPNQVSLGDVKGFNRTVIDNHFSKADRETNPEHWLAEAKFGVTQSICAWELIAVNLYENPLLYEEAKAQVVKWSDEELEKRFSQWLVGRFLGKAAEEALINLSSVFSESQKNYSWHLDKDGNVIFDEKTGNPLVIRPNEEGREFSDDLKSWRSDTNNIVKKTGASFDNVMIRLYPELLAYIPVESRESMSAIISESLIVQRNVIKQEFENIAAREERIFTNRRTRDIWSLRKKSDDESAKIFTDKLIAETDASCKKGIEEINAKIEQASAGVGDLAVLGEEWLRLYKEQFERGLKAWEDAEERFFIRRIEWEQDSFKQFSEGKDIWLSAYNQFEEEKQKWELKAKDLFQIGETLFKNISEDFEKNITDAKNEFELNVAIRAKEGTNKVKALIDIYLVCASTAISSMDNIKFWQNQYGNAEKDIRDEDFSDWILQEMENIWRQTEKVYLNSSEYKNALSVLKQYSSLPYFSFLYEQLLNAFDFQYSILSKIQEILKGEIPLDEQIAYAKSLTDNYFPKNKFEALIEMQNSYNTYLSYSKMSLNVRNDILKNYAELFETEVLKDILSPDVSSDDFYLDEYQIALLRAKALVLYWERKTSIADAVMTYAGELSAGRMTETEGIRAWEEAKKAYNATLAVYEKELNKLSKIGEDVQKQQEILSNMTVKLQKEEDILNNLYKEKNFLLSMSVVNMESFYSNDFNDKYNELVKKYKDFLKTGTDSVYFSALESGMLWDIAKQREAIETINSILKNNDDLSEEELTDLYNDLNALSPDSQKDLLQNTCNSLSLLFADYNLETKEKIFPDIQSLCNAIFYKSENFMENTAQFLLTFDKCFSTVPEWLDYEIKNWKTALIEYITMFAFSQEFQPKQNIIELTQLYNNFYSDYINLINYLNEIEYIDDEIAEQTNNEFLSISNNLMLINYKKIITESWEQVNLIASTENEKHWRQYLINNILKNKDSDLLYVSSWTAGVLEDALFYAAYYTNRINDSFNIYAKKDIYDTNLDSEQLLNLYDNEINKVISDFDLLYSQYNVIIDAAKAYELSILPPEKILKQISDLEEEIKTQESAVNPLKEQFFKESKTFIDIGSEYDNQYKILNTAHNNTNQKRLDYEKQDAIQRWANTSYINTDNIDPDDCKTKLIKAQTVLNILSDISNNENKITYNNSEYDALYTAYEQSFSRKLKLLETIQTLSSVYTQEAIYNNDIHNKYQDYLFQLGTSFNYQNYILPESKNEWGIQNVIVVKNGNLAFSTNESMILSGVDSAQAASVIDFFNTKKTVNGEQIKISDFEKALRGLSERMSGYFKNSDKFEQWSYARNYLLSSLISANGNLSFLSKNLSIRGALSSNGSLAKEYIKLSWDANLKTLLSHMEKNYFDKNPETLFKKAWNNLDANEKADLEFYVILTLNANNEYFAGFKDIYANNAYAYAKRKTDSLYSEAKDIIDTWYRFLEWPLWDESYSVNKSTYKRVSAIYSATSKLVSNWKNGLYSNLNSIKNTYSLYAASCQNLNNFDGIKADGQKVTWADLEKSLSLSKINSDDIALIKTYWETMQKNNSDTAYQGAFEALTNLLNWADEQVNLSKNNLETKFAADTQNQKKNEEIFFSMADNYINGTVNISDVKNAAKNAYMKNTISSIYYLDNMYGALIDNLSMYMYTDFNFYSLFSEKGNEIILLTEKTIKNKYNAELTARETEWSMTRKDLTEKYNEWQETAKLILENGRTDWIESYKKLQDAYKQWNVNFQSEYERVNNEWAYAYLAGLEDKEKWLEQAADAVNQASSEAFLSLVGAEGERLSRFMDTREPFGIRDAVPEAQALITSLLQSSGIVNMASAFNSLNNYTGITSPLVKRGIGGSSSWDSALVKAEASNYAKKANEEIAKNESKKIAYCARLSAQEAVKGLTENVNTANQNFRENMDSVFSKGLWSINGNNYVKDIIKGSTLFEPVVTQTVNIKGYRNYIMEPVTLKTNLDDDFLSGLDTIVIQGLINNIYIEVQTIADDIFGYDQKPIPITKSGVKREQSPGKFGTHIGYGPAEKNSGKLSRSEMFYDEGAGEMGRLLSDFQYWDAVDRAGSAELTIAPWDKRMWDDGGSWFTAPSIRTVGIIAGSVAAAVVTTAGSLGACAPAGIAGIALSVALCSSSEIALGALDVAFEYKALDEVAVSVGKTVLTNTVTSVIGSAFNGIKFANTDFKGLTNIAMGNASGSFNTILTQTLMTGTQTVTSGFASNLISGITYTNENKFGYSGDIFSAGIKGTLNNTLTSMASSFVSTGLTAINSGLDYSKIEGFNKLNQSDFQKLNGLIGSLAGQGVNYALGNDFTLNVLNLSSFTDNIFNSGLLELHLGHDGINMSIGTGGANVSIDNLKTAYRGAQVWNVNSKISKYGKENNFEALTSLRLQYGYGDSRQKDQLWDILNGNVQLNTEVEGKNIAETTISEDGKRVINLVGYEKGMSKEDQYLLGVVLGYEAYRDGYTIGQIDASGNLYTSQTQLNNITSSTIASMAMVERIKQENNWFGNTFEKFAFNDFVEKDMNKIYLSSYEDYYEAFYTKGVTNFNTVNKNDYQNNYKGIPLFYSETQAEVDAINDKRLREAYQRYAAPKFLYGKYNSYQEYLNSSEYKKYEEGIEAGLIEFKKNEKLLKDNGYIEKKAITISSSGCTFMSTKFGIETFLDEKIDTRAFHEYIKNLPYFSEKNKNELSRWIMADIMTKYTNGAFTVKYMENFGGTLTPEKLNTINSSNEQYLMHIRIKDPLDPNKGTHSVMVTSIEYTKDREGNITDISKFIVANPEKPTNHINTQTSYYPDQVFRIDTFKVIKNK